jgi:hypothetical protein
MAVMDGQEYQRRSRRMKIVSLVAGFILFLIVLGIGLFSGRLAHESTWELGVALVAMAALVIAAIVMVAVGFGMPPPQYWSRRAELAQWRRWHSCLYVYPLILLFWTYLVAKDAHDWAGGKRDWSAPVWLVMMAFFAAIYLSQLLGGRRGEPGTPQRRQYELLTDELSRAHAGLAFTWGFCVLGVGTIGAAMTALFAPLYAASAGVVAFGLGCAVACMRFGWLQRAAEKGAEAED